jgi:hypothetical protein
MLSPRGVKIGALKVYVSSALVCLAIDVDGYFVVAIGQVESQLVADVVAVVAAFFADATVDARCLGAHWTIVLDAHRILLV